MNFRAPQRDDWPWILEAYQDWPGRQITQEKVVGWIEKWTHRHNRICLVAELGRPIGLITYRPMFMTVYVDNLVVVPELRRRGFGRQIWRGLKDRLVAEGYLVAEFDTLPGAIRQQLGRRFIDIDGIHGRVTWDMEV